MKPTLFLLAAGMGSRYGGLKQLDGLGPNGETIMDYSIYDAINAGFGKLVFVIRKDFEQDFRDKIISKYEGHIPCELVFQALDALPEGFTCPADRTKPWGTNHAVMMGADVIKEPFAVINCDDFYGRDSFQVMGKFLSALPADSKNVYSMVGFRVGNTLSESGTVSRGICSTDDKGLLTSVVERTKIQRLDGEVKYIDDNGEWTATPDTTPVSMNFWGFTPDYFAYSQEFFKTFLSDPKNMENLKSEFFIPLMVDKLIQDGVATCEVLDTTSKWFGVTYPEDRQSVVDKIQAFLPDGLAFGRKQDVADQSACQDRVGHAAAEHGLHHQERIRNFRAAQHEHTRLFRRSHQLRNDAVFFFKQPPHRRRQHLLKAAQARLVAVRGSKCVADIIVCQRRQLLHKQRFSLLLMRELQLHLEERLLLGNIAHVVQQQNFSVLESADFFARSRPAHVVDPLYGAFQQAAEHVRVWAGAVKILVFNIAALMGEQNELCALVR